MPHLGQRLLVDPGHEELAPPLGGDEVRIGELFEVVGDRRRAEVKQLDDVADGARGLFEV